MYLRRAAGIPSRSTTCLWEFCAGDFELGMRAERHGMTILANHGCQNGFVPPSGALQVGYCAARPYFPFWSWCFNHVYYRGTNDMFLTLLVVYAACLAPHVLVA